MNGDLTIEMENPLFIENDAKAPDLRRVATGTTAEYFITEGNKALELKINAEIISHSPEKFK